MCLVKGDLVLLLLGYLDVSFSVRLVRVADKSHGCSRRVRSERSCGVMDPVRVKRSCRFDLVSPLAKIGIVNFSWWNVDYQEVATKAVRKCIAEQFSDI